MQTVNLVANQTAFNLGLAIITASESTDIEIRVTWNNSNYMNLIRATEAWLLIEEYGGY